VTPGRLTRPALPAAAVLAALAAVGCSDNSPPRPREYVVPTTGRAADTNRMSPKELTTFAAVSGVLAGAKAGKEEVARAKAEADAEHLATHGKAKIVAAVPPAPPVPAAPTPPAVVVQHGQTVISVGPNRTTERAAAKVPAPRRPAVSLGVTSDSPHKTKEEALRDALQVAQLELMKEFQKLDPPVHAKPSLAAIRSEYLRKDGVHEVHASDAQQTEWQTAGVEKDRMWVKLDIEVSEEQVQRLRAGERVNTAFQGGAVLFAVLLAAYGFFRLDAWTKGYLTSWLAIGAVALVAIAALAVLA
jgi:hypothetical protein